MSAAPDSGCRFDKLQLKDLFAWVEEQAHEIAAGTAATPPALLGSR